MFKVFKFLDFAKKFHKPNQVWFTPAHFQLISVLWLAFILQPQLSAPEQDEQQTSQLLTKR